MLDWLIIGGGIHGTSISHMLVSRKRVAREAVRVLDPHSEPLALWKRFTANTGMPYLRSPLVHHVHYDPWSARTFAESQRGKPLADFIALYERPSLEFFNSFSDLIIERYKLNALRIQGRAVELTRLEDGWEVKTDDNVLQSQRVVLAMGASEQPFYPVWAQHLRDNVQHIFADNFDRTNLPDDVVIIGGGISAAQLAIALADNDRSVTLMSRHPFRMAHFDSDPCWVTRLCLERFHMEPDYNKRRKIIQEVRNRGSMPPDVLERLEKFVESGHIDVRFDEVIEAEVSGDAIMLHTQKGHHFKTQQIVLATGFTRDRPGGAWLDKAVERYHFPLADDGYPIVDETLCWAEGLYVSGALAELEVGPVARNIIGARLAAERIARATL